MTPRWGSSCCPSEVDEIDNRSQGEGPPLASSVTILKYLSFPHDHGPSMYAARYWDGVHLALFWFAMLAGCGAARWSLLAGTYSGSVRAVGVAEIHGFWSQGFATGVLLLVCGTAAVTLAWATAEWIAGRSDRDAMRVAVKSRHRKVLM